ncbi:MAG: DUF262 domain-containing protein [Chitinophagaceae bacterium]|nr:DUF262 domain-containing protein [Chitinophagaceae bacterium]
MKAEENQVITFLRNPTTQFIIPVYQRNYDWKEEHCKQLLDDIINIASDTTISAHFIGSIIYRNEKLSTTNTLTEFVIIDGQQRITTLTLIYIALYRLCTKEKVNQKSTIESFLFNTNSNSKTEKLKLRPTENNDEAIKSLLEENTTEKGDDTSNIIKNFNYFQENITVDSYEKVIEGLDKLWFVEIRLGKEDDPQRIFESMNSTGLDLSQADLIRNYILMRLPPEKQNELYTNYWLPIEENTRDTKDNKNPSKTSDFIRDYLIYQNESIPNKDKVYSEFKKKFPFVNGKIENIEENLTEIKDLSEYYKKILNPEKETDTDIRIHLEYIKEIEITVSYPFLMKVYSDYGAKNIDKNIFIGVLELMQSFCIRRAIIGLPTNALNKIFASLCSKIKQVKQDSYIDSLERTLLLPTGTWKFPRNEEIIESIKSKDMYNSNNIKYILKRIEYHEQKEKVQIDNNITVEHIFPQTTTNTGWIEDLGEDICKQIKEQRIHTIGNLTLTGNNPELGNNTFAKKKDIYTDSSFSITRNITKNEKWGIEEIEQRCEYLTSIFLQVWECPDRNRESNTGEINIFEAEDPTSKKIEYINLLGTQIRDNNFTKMYTQVIQKLMELDFGGLDNLLPKIKLFHEQGTKPYSTITIEKKQYYLFTGGNNKQKFDNIKITLKALELQDGCFVKYSDEKDAEDLFSKND